MSSTSNFVHISGHVGKDPEIKMTPTGKKVCRFSIAEKKIKRDAPTRWHQCVAWEKCADLVEKHLTKGKEVSINGTLTYNTYTKDGVKHSRAEIVVDDIGFGRDAPGTPRGEAHESEYQGQGGYDEDLPFGED